MAFLCFIGSLPYIYFIYLPFFYVTFSAMAKLSNGPENHVGMNANAMLPLIGW